MKTVRLYVGNIPFDTTEEDVRAFFAPVAIERVKFVTDRETGRSRGFCFVEVAVEDADHIVQVKHREQMGGRTLVVNFAVEKTERDR